MDISVRFESLKDGKLVIEYKDVDFLKVHTYSVPLDFFITTESLVGLAIACRPKKIEVVSFKFPITPKSVEWLNKDYKISTDSPVTDDNVVYGVMPILGELPKRSKSYLSFSGGVDSLAARFLVGRECDALSIDFGQRFVREKQFFKKWQSLIIESDFRDKPFTESLDWRFMSAGAILMSDYLGIDTVVFGTILEASPYWFNVINRAPFEQVNHYQTFAISKLKSAQAVTSLSEYGTTKVASMFGARILGESIASAADDKTSKKLRKLLLGKIALNEEVTREWAEGHKPDDNPVSGKSFASDILGFYFSWKLGVEFTEAYIIQMSDEYRVFAETIDMSFFEKYNQFNLSSAPEDLRCKVVQIFDKIGLEPYSFEDEENLKKVRSFLAPTYNFSA